MALFLTEGEGSGRAYIRKLCKSIMDARLAVNDSKNKGNLYVSKVIFTNTEKTTGTLEDGTKVVTQASGAAESGDIGYRLKDGTWLVHKSSVRHEVIDGGGKGITVQSDAAFGGPTNTYWIQKLNSETQYIIPVAALGLEVDKMRAVLLSSNGKHLLIGTSEPIEEESSTFATDGILLKWIIMENFTLNSETLLVESDTSGTIHTYNFTGDLIVDNVVPASPSSGFSFGSAMDRSDGVFLHYNYTDVTGSVSDPVFVGFAGGEEVYSYGGTNITQYKRKKFYVDSYFMIFSNDSNGDPTLDFVGSYQQREVEDFIFYLSSIDTDSSGTHTYTVGTSLFHRGIDTQINTSVQTTQSLAAGYGGYPAGSLLAATKQSRRYQNHHTTQGVFLLDLIAGSLTETLHTGDATFTWDWVSYPIPPIPDGPETQIFTGGTVDNLTLVNETSAGILSGEYVVSNAFRAPSGDACSQFHDPIANDYPFYSPDFTEIASPADAYDVISDTHQFSDLSQFPGQSVANYTKATDSETFQSFLPTGSGCTLIKWRYNEGIVRGKSLSGRFDSANFIMDWCLF